MLRKNVLSFFLLSVTMAFSQAQVKKIKGIVTDGADPLPKASIMVKETDRGVESKEDGSYEIYADEGQTLIYSYVGKKTTEVIVEDVTTILNVTLYDNIEELDEVVVTKRKKKSQKDLLYEYNSNKNLIKTRFGILDKDRAGYALKIFEGDELNPAAFDFISALQSRLSGMIVIRPMDDPYSPVVYLNSMKKLLGQSAIYEVDGMMYEKVPNFIQANTIKRIAVLSSLAGASKYGMGAAGGVIVINTKTANYSAKEPGSDKPYDLAKRRDNYFEEGSAVALSQITAPQYIEELSLAGSKVEAMDRFQELEKKYGSSPFFYLDAFSFFSKKYGTDTMQKSIGERIQEKFNTDPTILKALAYLLEEQKDYQWANGLYKHVFVLRPHYAQSYLDLAQSYEDVDALESAATLYARYDYLVRESLMDSSATFSPIIKRDFNNFLGIHGAVLGNTNIVKTEEDDFDGVRLLFEWNNSEAEFELQLVGPENQYHTWEHTQWANEERIMEEKTHGFSTQEYLIYRPILGNWVVNAKYLGNKSLTPTYLKATVYYDYGTKSQHKETRVFKLTAKNVNQALFQIKNGNSISVY
ncbi:MAG: carboxypeptidase-like regulatory domain-containing protein [Allomuricauda sp.]